MDLEPKHNQAIREEIAECLRALLSRNGPNLPQPLRELLSSLDEADIPARAESPSLIPNATPETTQRQTRSGTIAPAPPEPARFEEVLMKSFAALLAGKQRVLERLHEEPDAREREQLERFLNKLNAALDLLDEVQGKSADTR